MKNILLFLILSFPICCLAQKVSPSDSVTKEIISLFNDENFEQIYSDCSNDFHDAISKSQFLAFCVQLKFSEGKIKKYFFLRSESAVEQYDIVFEKDTLNMWLGLSKKKKIATLFFKPHEIKIADKTEISSYDNPLKSKLDFVVDSIMRPYILRGSSVGAIIGIIKNDQNFIYRYGETKRGNKTLPDTNTIFEIASISKTFTSLLLSLEVQKNKINLNDPINKFLPSSVPFQGFHSKPVLIKYLANHSSGLPGLPSNFSNQKPFYDNDNPYKNYGKQEMYSFLKTYKYSIEPGKKYEYSNFAVGLLGNILEKATDLTFEQLLEKEICKPLNLTNTRLKIASEKEKQIAQGYNSKREAVHLWDFKALAAAGGIRSTINDMVKYAKAYLKPPNEQYRLAIELCEKISFEGDSKKVGLGWHLINTGSKNIYFHNGQTSGFVSFISYDREKKSAVIILVNSITLVDKEGVELMKYLEK